MSDSTNALSPGASLSESVVDENLGEIFTANKNNRIILATFASNVYRIKHIMETCRKNNRKIALFGRSMENMVDIAIKCGYFKDKSIIITAEEANHMKPSEVCLLCTGSQGEPLAALSRIASGSHRQITLMPDDVVIFSSSPIPGNTASVSKTINKLYKKGVKVFTNSMTDIHSSGHANQEELKLMIRLFKPKYFVPYHGEYRMLKIHAELAEELGMPSQNIFVNKTGDVLEIDRNSAKVTGTIPTGNVLVDGLGVGDVGNIVLRDRKHLSEDGLMIVVVTISKEDGRVLAGPDIISRGFVYVRESEDLMDGAKNVIKDVLRDCEDRNIKEWAYLKNNIKESLKEYLYQKTKRNPMILPIIMEV